MNIFQITMAVILATAGSIPIEDTIVTQAPDQPVVEQTMVIRGVASTETIITEKPVAVKAVQSPSQTKTSFYQSSETELAGIPEGQGSCFDYVPTYATKYGVDADLLTRIIRAESGGNPLSKNKNSTASGCGQFIRSTWAGTLRQMGREWVTPFDAEANVEAMAWKIAHGGIGAWNASKSKWGK